jgi:hypothetical protein
MKFPFQRLERYVENILERSVGIFPPPEISASRITSTLIQVAEERAERDPSNLYWVAPNLFTVSLHETALSRFRSRPGFPMQLERRVMEYIRQREMILLGTLTVFFHSDSNLPVRAVHIQAEFASDSHTTSTLPGLSTGAAPLELPPGAFLILPGDPHRPLRQPVIHIGRHTANQIVLDDPLASRRHALLRARQGRYVLTDLGSKHGTRVNRVPVSECLLAAGDVIRIGHTDLIYGDDNVDERTQPLHMDAFDTKPKIASSERES